MGSRNEVVVYKTMTTNDKGKYSRGKRYKRGKKYVYIKVLYSEERKVKKKKRDGEEDENEKQILQAMMDGSNDLSER